MNTEVDVRRVPLLVEAGHIYMDEVWTDEHARGLRIGESLMNDSSGLCMFVDDVNVREKKWEIDYVFDKIRGVDVGFVGLEGSLVGVADALITRCRNVQIERFSKKTVYVYDDGERRFGLREVSDSGVVKNYCVLLSMAWALCKLGVFDYVDVLNRGVVSVGDRIVTVLPKRFETVERNVLYLVERLYGRSYSNRMSYVFFE